MGKTYKRASTEFLESKERRGKPKNPEFRRKPKHRNKVTY